MAGDGLRQTGLRATKDAEDGAQADVLSEGTHEIDDEGVTVACQGRVEA